MAKAVKASRPAQNARKSSPTSRSPAPAASPPRSNPALLTGALLFTSALILAFIVYAPSLSGDFVFDDRTLPMFVDGAASWPLRFWLGVRPLLMATYYLNFHTTGLSTSAYHAVNVFLHAGCSVMIFFAVRRILEWTGVTARARFRAALFGSALFLLHPLQTEAVSYIASRSETLSVLFFLAAFNVFLYRPRLAIGWGTSAAILVLYACAMSCKEHTAVLPAVLLLTDYFFNPGWSTIGIRRNWRLYAPVTGLAASGLIYFARHIQAGSNLGFSMRELPWYAYLFTQFRAMFVYFRLFLFPYGQSVDYDFPVSNTILEHGAIFYGIILLLLAAAAIYYRKRFPLACYSFLLCLILFAPTSSFMPIRDPLVERRLYLPFIGLALLACDAGLRIRWSERAALYTGCAVCLICAVLTYNRNEVWVNMDSLWRDAAAKNPKNPRALMGLADAYALGGHCAEAIPYFERVAAIQPTDYKNAYNLANAYDCANQLPAAVAAYRKAIALKNSPDAWVHMAMVQMKNRQYDQAMDSLDQAQKINRDFLLTYTYRGILLLAEGRFYEAAAQFRNVLANIPDDPMALRGMDRAQKQVRQF